MDAASETQELKHPRRWWLRMIVASAALVAVMLGVVFLTPIVRLHYHAWQYRKSRHDHHLEKASGLLRERGASVETVKRLLGEPADSRPYAEGGLLLMYEGNFPTVWEEVSSIPVGKALDFENGRLKSVRTWTFGEMMAPLNEPPRGIFFAPKIPEKQDDK